MPDVKSCLAWGLVVVLVLCTLIFKDCYLVFVFVSSLNVCVFLLWGCDACDIIYKLLHVTAKLDGIYIVRTLCWHHITTYAMNIFLHVNLQGTQRLRTSGQFMGPSHILNADKLLRSSNMRLGMSLSPSRDGADRPHVSKYDEFQIRQAPRTFERASPSHTAPEFSHGRSFVTRSHYPEEGYHRLESSSASNAINGREHQNLRALIDAYGNDDRDMSLRNRKFPVDSLDIKNNVGTISWQETEEQEYDWEDMNPSLVDNGRIKEGLPFRAARTRIGSGKHVVSPEADIHNNRLGQPRLSSLDDSSVYTGIDVGLIFSLPQFHYFFSLSTIIVYTSLLTVIVVERIQVICLTFLRIL